MMRARLLVGLLTAGLALSACSLAGDVTPPPGSQPISSVNQQPAATQPGAEAPVAEPTTSGPVDVTTASPARKPSAVSGSVLYAAHCAECHGATGQSDGGSVSKLPAPPPVLADPATLRGMTPRDVFTTITQGRLDKFMPPFGDSLTDAERWDLTAYVYALSTTQEEVDQGKDLYIANCGECHGESGQTLRDWTSADYIATTSPQTIYDAIQAGVPEIDDHVFAAKLSEAELWSVVDFARTLSYEYLAPGALLPEQAGTVIGQIANGTAGGAKPADLSVNLIGFTDMSMSGTYTATADADGRVTFEAVPFTQGEQFILTTEYGGATYHSDVFSFESGQTSAQIALPVYDVTDDPAAIRISQLHTFVMFENAGQVTIGQMAVVSNDGDKTYAPSDGKTIRLSVPAGASGVASPDGLEGETYAVDEQGYVDLRPVPPGDSSLQVFFQYQMPYSGQLDFAQRLDYPADVVNLLIGDTSVGVTGEGVSDLGTQSIQGMTFQQFQRSNLAAGDTLAFDVSGTAGSSSVTGTAGPAAPLAVTTGNTVNIGIGLFALAALLAGVGYWWYRRRGDAAAPRAEKPADREELLDAIAELDDDLAAGKISPEDHRRERAWLMAELQKVWTE